MVDGGSSMIERSRKGKESQRVKRRGTARSRVEGEERKSKTDDGTSDNSEVYRLQKV